MYCYSPQVALSYQTHNIQGNQDYLHQTPQGIYLELMWHGSHNTDPVRCFSSQLKSFPSHSMCHVLMSSELVARHCWRWFGFTTVVVILVYYWYNTGIYYVWKDTSASVFLPCQTFRRLVGLPFIASLLTLNCARVWESDCLGFISVSLDNSWLLWPEMYCCVFAMGFKLICTPLHHVLSRRQIIYQCRLVNRHIPEIWVCRFEAWPKISPCLFSNCHSHQWFVLLQLLQHILLESGP